MFTGFQFAFKASLLSLVLSAVFLLARGADAQEITPKIVRFASGELTLGGELFLPQGKGPFPMVLFNHGSAPKMTNSYASKAIAPVFLAKGWGFFMPYRRGQGLSEAQGPYIMDEIRAARWTGWGKAAQKLVELHQTAHLDDQMAALSWLKRQPFVLKDKIATMGNSFGGIQVMLGVAQSDYCAGVSAGGAAQSWDDASELQQVLKHAARHAKAPVLFFQARNDFDLAPTRILSETMLKAGKHARAVIYPAFGSNAKQGHSLAYRGVSVWENDVLSFINQHCGNTDSPI